MKIKSQHVLALALMGSQAISSAASTARQDTLSGYCEVVQTPDQTLDNPNAGKPPQRNYISFTDVMATHSLDRGVSIADPSKNFQIKNIHFLELPKHGVLTKDGEYIPTPGHRGLDQFTASMEVNGKKYKIIVKLVTVGHKHDGPYFEQGEPPEYRLANQCEVSKVRRVGGVYLRESSPA